MASNSSESPSSDESIEQLWPFLAHQRERENSMPWDMMKNEDPVIVQGTVDYLWRKLSDPNLRPPRWMSVSELYYMEKIGNRKPWEATDILTPTPPSELEALLNSPGMEGSTQDDSGSMDHENTELQRPPQQATALPKPRSTNELRYRQPKPKRTKGGIQKKQKVVRKHTMVTRSRCRGGCCRGIEAS